MMRETGKFTVGIVGTASAGLLLGCAGQGVRYSEVVNREEPVASGQTRVVLLRPNDRYDDYSLSRAVLRVNDSKVGKLAYGGFLVVNVEAGLVAITASARNPMFGMCELQIATQSGDTVYLDVAPRTANVVATLVGSAVGAGTADGGATHVAMKEILVDESTARIATGSSAGALAGSAAESIGRKCGGPFEVTRMSASAALERLEHLSWSD